MKIEIYTASQDIPQLVDGSPLHSKRMFCLLESHTEARPIMIAAFDNDNKELGHILVVKYREWRLLPPGFHIWYTIHGQGVYSSECNDKEHLFKLLIDKLFDLFDFNHTLIDIRNLDDARFAYDTLSDKGFFPRRDRRMYISLHSKEPEKRLTRAYKANIRKAQKRGVTFREVNNTQEALVAIKMMRRYYASKIGRHLPHKIPAAPACRRRRRQENSPSVCRISQRENDRLFDMPVRQGACFSGIQLRPAQDTPAALPRDNGSMGSHNRCPQTRHTPF